MTAESLTLRSIEADAVINKTSQTRIKKNRHGAKGERFVLEALKAEGKKVLHAAKSDNRLGYDIVARDEDGSETFHEVKSSAKKKFAPSIWYIAKKQYDTARANLGKYFFWFINALNSKQPEVRKYSPDQLKFRAARFQVQVKSSPLYRMQFQASKLYEALAEYIDDFENPPQREQRTLSQEKRLVAMSVLTKKLLEQRLNYSSPREGIKNVEVNLKQASQNKPFHLKYTDGDGKDVLVDLKVSETVKLNKNNFKFYITKKRREQSMRLKPESKTRRELWYCLINPETKNLEVRVFDISGKEFWKHPKNDTSVDYYSFKVKED